MRPTDEVGVSRVIDRLPVWIDLAVWFLLLLVAVAVPWAVYVAWMEAKHEPFEVIGYGLILLASPFTWFLAILWARAATRNAQHHANHISWLLIAVSFITALFVAVETIGGLLLAAMVVFFPGVES